MSQDMHLGKSVHDNSWGMFTDFLTYKMERAGKKLIRIDRWYHSSKTCSSCGKVKEDLQLSDRIYECVCGNRMDRDENAAINICREGIRISGMKIDKENKIITTKDSGEEGVLGDDCLIDCSQIPMIYCNYDTQDVIDITLDDLQVGDEIILTIRSSEIENLQKEDDNKAKIAVEQLQLGTQRIK